MDSSTDALTVLLCSFGEGLYSIFLKSGLIICRKLLS
jgi:hypothetical protein